VVQRSVLGVHGDAEHEQLAGLLELHRGEGPSLLAGLREGWKGWYFSPFLFVWYYLIVMMIMMMMMMKVVLFEKI
jgi:hypothetical protein